MNTTSTRCPDGCSACTAGTCDDCCARIDATPDPGRPHLWLCGCLINDGPAHRVGCPVYPEGRR